MKISMPWYRHPIEWLLWWWRGFDEPNWRTRLFKPFIEETYEFRWANDEGRVELEELGQECVGSHPLHREAGRKHWLMKRRVR